MRKLFHVVFVFVVVIVASSGCGDDSTAPPVTRTNEELIASFQQLLDNAVARDAAIRNAVMMVDAPLRNLRWKGAAGMADPAARDTMLPDDQFRTASIGKMTCATLVMMLVKDGQFALEDSIHRHLPAGIMNGLHILGTHDYSDDITVRHLLSHRSGLADYIGDGDENADGVSGSVLRIGRDPHRSG